MDDRLLAEGMSLTRTEHAAHLHEEETWHYVGAGLLQASVFWKAARHPPLCSPLASNHLWGQKIKRSEQASTRRYDKGLSSRLQREKHGLQRGSNL